MSLAVADEDIPLYRQVKEHILARIRSGEWTPGGRIPSENRLTRDLGVSRMTAHRALRELTAEGWIERVQGAGTFVAQSKPQLQALAAQDLATEIRARGHHHSAKVYILRSERVGLAGQALLDLPPGSEIFHSLIVHRENGVPVLLEDRYVNATLAPHYLEQDFTRITASQYLPSIGALTRGEHIIEAIKPDTQVQAMLEIPADEPCLLVRRRTWSGPGMMTAARLIYPGSRYSLGGELRPQTLSARR